MWWTQHWAEQETAHLASLTPRDGAFFGRCLVASSGVERGPRRTRPRWV